MKIIEPKVELLEENDSVSHVARCARICYRKETGNDKALYDSLIKRNHLSMFRHITYYYIVPKHHAPEWINIYFDAIKLNANIVGIDISCCYGTYFIVVNGQWYIEHNNLISEISKYNINNKWFVNACEVSRNMTRYTFKVTTQISTSRELNRVSPNNIAEQSTRYVYEDGTICRPHWMTKEEADYLNTKEILDDDWIVNHCWAKRYIWSTDNSFDKYKVLVDAGLHRQDARGVLPLDTATICAYTYSAHEWYDIIDLRYYGITGQPHPNTKLIAGMIREKLMELGYKFR